MADGSFGNIEEFSSTGTDLGSFGNTEAQINDVAFDNAGNLYVSAPVAGLIVKFTPDGTPSVFLGGGDLNAPTYMTTQAVPEPSAWVMLALGLVALCVGVRQRSRRPL